MTLLLIPPTGIPRDWPRTLPAPDCPTTSAATPAAGTSDTHVRAGGRFSLVKK